MSIEATKQMVDAIEADLKLFNIPATARMLEALNAGRQAIAEAEKQEPGEPIGTFKRQHWISGSPGVVILHQEKEQDMHDGENVYTHPQPKREPLTDDEIWKNDDIMAANSGYGANFKTLREVIRAVEAAHGIRSKNMSIETIKIMLDALENHTAIKHPQQVYYRDKAIEAGRQAIAEAEKQEPVAISDCGEAGHDDGCCGNSQCLPSARRAHPQPKREWVGLTDEERHEIREWQRIQEELGPVWSPMMMYLYLSIDAKLKEKNT